MAMKICRTCLQVLSNDANCLSLDTDECGFDYPTVRSKLLVCVPELALDVVQCAVICITCSDALNTAYDFKNKCLQTEERIMNYTQYTGCSTDSVNISEVIQFNEVNSECNSMENRQQLTDVHYPITQIIEQDSEIDIKPVILTNNISESAAPESYLYEPEINVTNIKTEVDTSECGTGTTEVKNKVMTQLPFSPEVKHKVMTQLPFSPELDVEVRVYKNESMDVFSHSMQIAPMNYNNFVANPYGCSYCQKQFPVLTELDTHLLTHIENRPLKCTMCDRRFVRKDKLMLHMRIHTGEKPFECPMCGRCFSRKDKLNNHVRTHTGEKPHQCILCQKSFARKDKMNTHMRSQHWLALANLEITVVKNEQQNANPVEPSISENAPSQ